jgi:hypothetical protein
VNKLATASGYVTRTVRVPLRQLNDGGYDGLVVQEEMRLMRARRRRRDNIKINNRNTL